MALIVKDRVLESSTSTGTGSFTLTGAQTGYQSFSAIGNGNTTYYTIQGKNPDGTLTGEWEVGEGTWSTGNTLARNTVFANSLGTTAKVSFSAGDKDVFVTYPSDKALLGNTSAVSSTGTGSVVLNSNPTFATDITVNDITVGKGAGNIATNTAFGVDAIGSPFISALNINNVGIGYNALNTIGSGVATLTLLTGGSGYAVDDDLYQVQLIYVSGTPVLAGGVLPTIQFTISGGVVTAINSIVNNGYGFLDTTTVFTIPSAIFGDGSGFTCQIASLKSATDNIALGYNAGNTNLVGSNSIYIGSGALGTGTNEIVIGANATGSGDNSVVIGNTSTTGTILRGAVAINNSGGLSVTGALNLSGLSSANQNIATSQTSGSLTIGGTSGTGAITLGRSTVNQTVNIATGGNGNGNTKTVNIGTGATNSGSTNNINIGPILGAGTLTFGQATGSQTTNIQAGATASGSTKTMSIGTGGLAGSTTNIAIGSTAGTSTTTVNGLLRQQTYLVAGLPTGSAGARSFVTNALAPTFGAAVVGGGAVGVPVYHDGTSWKVG
jgi:hypothetical protein